ncbi:hypothetical protein AVEN_259738-1 [Araneus ventricosus]|uniref:Uncharacterized protein n=1 Tax=Araneus ventricosus TaxID=182803 RepID=A0A4Y2D2P5_ARAVE|nr:hypothetical protein AVEN_259738-1 [Araneus ventricosus]
MRWLTRPENTLNHGSRTTDTNNHPRLKFVKKARIMKNIIDDWQELAQIRRDARRELKEKGSEDDPLFGFEYELSRHQEKIDHAEVSLKRQGPCPIVNCTSHHAPIKDVEMVDSGQYANTISPKTPNLSPSKLTPNNEFKLVSPKKSAESQSEEPKTVIETSNRFLNLMDVSEKDSINDSPKISSPVINLKLTEDYNITVQEISRNFHETIIKFNRGFIRISPFSLD